MNDTALVEVCLWGSTIGAAWWPPGASHALFEYDPAFAASGIEVAPLTMPASREVYSFPQLNPQTWCGLPGLLADSLPDRFGNALIDAWLARQGRDASSFTPLERLCYVGKRGMGALEFAPATGPEPSAAQVLQVDRLVALANAVLNERRDWAVDLDDPDALSDILRVGTSAGGARAKAVIAWNPATGEVRSGQAEAPEGFEHWLLKFDGVHGNRDRELDDPMGFGAIEYAYALMVQDAGIHMSPCRLLEEGGRRHFMTRRFDRTEDGGRLHLQSLCAMAHLDFNMPGAHSYEQAFGVIRELKLGMTTTEELFRRMAFNIVARNQDDHTKNIAFLMDRSGTWRLAPAFDITWSFNPQGAWTSRHQMSLNGKRDHFERRDFRILAQGVSMKRGRAETILGEVCEIVRQWPEYARRVNIPEDTWRPIQSQHRLDLAP